MWTSGWKWALALLGCAVSAEVPAADRMERGARAGIVARGSMLAREESRSGEGCGIVVMFWNLENFFDFNDGGTGASDAEFTPSGARHWTSGRFYAKCRAISKTILWTADRNGRLPDIIGFAEVENRKVLERMLSATALRKCGYGIVHRDSPDHRGIDVALLWRKKTLSVKDCGFVKIDSMRTREILYARAETVRGGRDSMDSSGSSDSCDISFVVTHFPSKYGGSSTDVNRLSASWRLKALCDSLTSAGTGRIIAMGDFNDESASPAFDPLRDILVNAETTLPSAPEGTIRYEGRWEQIDMFWSSSGFGSGERVEVLRVPFLMAVDNVYSGEKPLRTYSGPRYLGGVSDHCPIILKLSVE